MGMSVREMQCPICGKELDPDCVAELGLDPDSVQLIGEKVRERTLVRLLRIGEVAESLMQPEQLRALEGYSEKARREGFKSGSRKERSEWCLPHGLVQPVLARQSHLDAPTIWG